MTAPADFPLICVEEKRYDLPTAGWVFVWLTPAPVDKGACELPFNDENTPYEECVWYTRRVEGWGPDSWARGQRDQLAGYESFPLDESVLGPTLYNYVIHKLAPLEWQRSLEEGDTELATRIKVWIKGDLPTATKGPQS